MKYLGVTIDNQLNYQTEVKDLLSKMAQIFKCLYNLRDCLPKNRLPVMINSLVMCHLQYPAVVLSTVDNSLVVTLEKQLSWAVKACYHRSKFDSSTDIKLQQKILPVHILLDYRITWYTFLLITNRKPAFNSPIGLSLPTSDSYKHQGTGNFFHRTVIGSKYYDKSVIRIGIEVFNKLPKSLLFSPGNYATFKRNLRDFFYNSLLLTIKIIILVKFQGLTSNFRDFLKAIFIK